MFHDDNLGLAYFRRQIDRENRLAAKTRAPTPRPPFATSDAVARATAQKDRALMPPFSHRDAEVSSARGQAVSARGKEKNASSAREGQASARGLSAREIASSARQSSAREKPPPPDSARLASQRSGGSSSSLSHRSSLTHRSARGDATRASGRQGSDDDIILESVRSDWDTPRVERKLKYLMDEKTQILARIAEVDDELQREKKQPPKPTKGRR